MKKDLTLTLERVLWHINMEESIRMEYHYIIQRQWGLEESSDQCCPFKIKLTALLCWVWTTIRHTILEIQNGASPNFFSIEIAKFPLEQCCRAVKNTSHILQLFRAFLWAWMLTELIDVQFSIHTSNYNLELSRYLMAIKNYFNH